jgi:hypothetical protein
VRFCVALSLLKLVLQKYFNVKDFFTAFPFYKRAAAVAREQLPETSPQLGSHTKGVIETPLSYVEFRLILFNIKRSY